MNLKEVLVRLLQPDQEFVAAGAAKEPSKSGKSNHMLSLHKDAVAIDGKALTSFLTPTV